tara:strand:+ start:632 stop:913 length:282 start_codon:yes stop_codon:yes gene_type:complete
MNPNLVEGNIKNIINYNLKTCKQLKFKYYSLIINVFYFILIISIISIILYFKYKKNTNYNELREKEIKKRDYILYNLRKYQNIKNKHITNIPL